jgi:CRISPR-associated endonuclease/helicase Cas3
MHVLIIDKSHGKARKRSQALLDSYALRTGDASWSTPITREAMLELRQALRRSASRHTCVGCYVNVGRSRLRLAWVVGRQSEFDAQGATPVATTRRKRKAYVPAWIRRIALLAAAAGYVHDLGKASRLFQQKLRARSVQADRVRHEWLSLQVWRQLRAGARWQQAWTLGGPTGALMTELPPFMERGIANHHDAVDFLIASHHRLFGRDSGQSKQPHSACENPAAGLHIRPEPPCSPETLEPESTVDGRILAAAAKAEHRAGELTIEHLPESGWWASAVLARLALIFADHEISSLDHPDPKATLHANTRRTPGRRNGHRSRPNQSLPWHLNSVGGKAGTTAVQMFDMKLEGLSRHSIDSILAPSPNESRFAWQNTATEALHRLQARGADQVLVMNTAGTGAGKTRMNAKVVCALASGPVRFSIVLNLRSLTLQTGDAMRSQLGVMPDELAVVIGDPLIRELYGQDGGRSMETGVDVDENPEVEMFSGAGETFELPDWLDAWARRHPGQHQLLGAPLLVSTIDYLIASGEPQKQQHHVNAMFRLLSGSDLILDEIDAYEPGALVAVLRLIQMAALSGRNVVVSSATLARPVADAVHAAYASGAAMRSAMIGRGGFLGVHTALISDTQPPCLISPDESFQEAYEAFVASALARLASPDTVNFRLAETFKVLPKIAARSRQAFASPDALWFCRASNAMETLHVRHRWAFGSSGRRISIGLIRVANIRVAVRLARYLADRNLSEGPEIRVACYHSQELLIHRHLKERRLDFLLSRQHSDEHIVEDEEIASIVNSSRHKDVIFVVVATPVEEIGRDHDFDWAVVEPSSCQSIVQVAGRVNRHRLRRIEEPNVLVLDLNYQAMTDAARGTTQGNEEPWTKPVFHRPGLEEPGHLYRDPNGRRAVAVSRLLGVRYPIDARLRFDTENYLFAALDDKSTRRQLEKPLKILASTGSSPSPVLTAQGFYERFPLREREPRQILRVRPDEGELLIERYEQTDEGAAWIERRGVRTTHNQIHPKAWLAWDVPDLLEACETLGVDPLEALRVETRAIDLSRLEWDRSFGWYSMPSDESSQAPAIRAT